MSRLREPHEPLTPERPPEGDLLRTLFKRQRAIMDLYHRQRPNSALGSRSARLALMAVALGHEAAELLAWLPWKPWRKEYGRALTDEEQQGVIEELTDLLHFLVEAYIEAGVGPEEVVGYYLAKNRVNRERVEGDY